MSFLALWGIASGGVLTPFAQALAKWFGWGSILVILGIAYLGWFMLQRESRQVRWGQLFGLELAALFTLGLLAVFGGNDLIRAESGWDGGRLGWGLVTGLWQLAGAIWGSLILFLLWALAIMSGFGLWPRLEAWLLQVAGDASSHSTPVSPFVEEKNRDVAI